MAPDVEEMIQRGKHGPVPTLCCCIHFKTTYFLSCPSECHVFWCLIWHNTVTCIISRTDVTGVTLTSSPQSLSRCAKRLISRRLRAVLSDTSPFSPLLSLVITTNWWSRTADWLLVDILPCQSVWLHTHLQLLCINVRLPLQSLPRLAVGLTGVSTGTWEESYQRHFNTQHSPCVLSRSEMISRRQTVLQGGVW